MKKFLPLIPFLFFVIQGNAQAKIWASAVCLHVNGNTAFYNTLTPAADAGIGEKNLEMMAGVFGGYTAGFKLIGGAIFSSNQGQKICNAAIHYTIYPQGSRPAQPIFVSLPLQLACQCDGSRFAACGNNRCNTVADQKFEYIGHQLDLTNRPNGSYTLEFYYTANAGDATCDVQTTDNGNNSGYRTNFIIATPLAINYTQLSGTAFPDYIRVNWKVNGDEEAQQYILEKSLNGIHFFTINAVVALQQSTVLAYQSYDNNPVIGTNYYRIKTIYKNGSASLSRVFRLYYGKVGNTVFVYPATEGQPLRVRLVAVPKGYYRLTIFTQTGQQLATQMLQHDGIDKNININMPSRMPKGIYRLLLIDRDKFFKQSFIIH
jgi:hypothetical protein